MDGCQFFRRNRQRGGRPVWKICIADQCEEVEHLVSDAFTQEGYGDEAGRRFVRLKDLYERGSRLSYDRGLGRADSADD